MVIANKAIVQHNQYHVYHTLEQPQTGAISRL